MEVISKYIGSGEIYHCRTCDTEIIIPRKTQETNEEPTLLKPTNCNSKETYNSELDTPKISKKESNFLLEIKDSTRVIGSSWIAYF